MLFFWFFFEIFVFHFFHILLFTFSNIKKTKTKSAHFFSKTLFLTPWQTAKKLFRTPTHYLCFFRPAKNTIKLGENKQKKILDGFSTQPWTDFQLKNPQILDGFSTLQHIYIVIYIDGPRLICSHNFPQILPFSPVWKWKWPQKRDNILCTDLIFYAFRILFSNLQNALFPISWDQIFEENCGYRSV